MPDRSPRDDRLWTWVGVGIAIAGAAVRFWDLDAKSLWFDEALSLDDSRSLAERFGSGFHPPVYYWVLHAWTAVFGDSPTAARLTAAIPGALTLAVVFAAGRRMFSARAGALAAAVLALSSLHVEYSQEVRMYALATFFSALALWAAAEAVAREPVASPRARWALAGASALAAMLAAGTHYLSLFVLAGLAVGLAAGWPASRPLVARLAALAAPVALAGLAVVLASGYAKQLRAAAGFFAARGGVNQTIFDDAGARLVRFPVDLVVEILPGLNLKWLAVADYRWPAVVLFDLVAVAAFVLLAQREAPRWARAVTLATALVPLPVIAAMLGTAQLRFYVVATPFVALAVGAGLDAIRRPAWAAPAWAAPAWAAPALAAALVLLSALAVGWYFDPGMDKQPWRRAGTLVGAQARPGDVVLVNEPHLMIAFERYFDRPEGVLLEGYPEVGGVRIREGDLERWFLPLVRDRKRVWFVRMSATASQSDPEGLALRWLGENWRLVSRLREPGYNGAIEIYLFEQ